MAARQELRFCGLAFTVTPDYWLRRWFPPARLFYFESHNPSFRVDVTRYSQGAWPFGESIPFKIVFADGRSTERRDVLPDLAVGETERLYIDKVLTTTPGQTRILIQDDHDPALKHLHYDIFSYEVGREATLWVGGALLVFAAANLIGVLSQIGVLGGADVTVQPVNIPAPVNNIEIEIVLPTDIYTPTPQPTPDMSDSPPRPVP